MPTILKNKKKNKTKPTAMKSKEKKKKKKKKKKKENCATPKHFQRGKNQYQQEFSLIRNNWYRNQRKQVTNILPKLFIF